ncbi:MAG TPA: ankyrin repeat domain-containing protein [Candidatus Angelobacter sp.]|nr:ankyrin repeat domain-containing protein [Candidatus Angelobacter sp.]
MSANVPQRTPLRELPKNPNLEQLRKQAKDLLQQYRSGDPTATAEVERYEQRPNPATFALHDAQRVLARSYGYDSWPKLRAFVDGATVAKFAEAVNSGDIDRVRSMLASRPELVSIDRAENDEHRALHYAVLRRDAPMVRILMEAGADSRKGIWPHRDATQALTLARDRGYDDVVAIIEEEERLRREEMSCPNATISPEQDRIHRVILQGDRETAIRLLDSDPSLIRACDRDGATPLHLAAQKGDEELTAWLLQRGAAVRKEDVHGLTALDRAALAADPRNGKAELFPTLSKLLLAHGAHPTIRAAIAWGDLQRIYEMIREKPELLREIRPSGGLLTLAVNHGQIDAARMLLDLGADADERIVLQEVEDPTPSWGMPLWYAALAGHLEMTRLLLDRGADPNANVYASGWPLLNAWTHQHESVKRLLVERGAKVHPYMLAETHDVGAAKRLLAEDTSEETVRELVWAAADHGCPEIVELALPHLTWPRDDPRWHWILIQPIRGARAASPESLNLGLDLGLDLENRGHFQSLAILLRHGINPNITRFGQTALHFAAAHHGEVGEEDRAKFGAMLLDHGAKLELRDNLLQSTPLGWACRWGRDKLAEVLLQRGAPADELDAAPWATPRAWAEKMKHYKILTLLESHGLKAGRDS